MTDFSSFPVTVITGLLTVALFSALFVVKRESSKRRYVSILTSQFFDIGIFNEMYIDLTSCFFVFIYCTSFHYRESKLQEASLAEETSKAVDKTVSIVLDRDMRPTTCLSYF